MVDYTKSQQWKKEKRENLTGEGHNIKFIDLRFERGQVVGFGKGRRRQDVPCLSRLMLAYAIGHMHACNSI